MHLTQTDVERTVAQLWADALGVDSVERDDNFFDLGGNSITAIRMLPVLSAQFGVEPNVGLLFDHPTPAAVAAALLAMRADAAR